LLFTNSPVITTAGANTVLFRGTNLTSGLTGAGTASIKDGVGFTLVGSGTANQTTKSILPWALIDGSNTGLGTSFATADTGNSNLRALNTATEYASDFLTSAANVRLTNAVTLSTGTSMNSLTLESGGAVTIGTLQGLTLSSGGLLSKAASTISGGFLLASGGTLYAQILGDLTISTVLSGGPGTSSGGVSFAKAGAGTLTLAPPSSPVAGMAASTYTGQWVLNQGTLKLAGGINTIAQNNFLEIGLGATLDLNGNSQWVYDLFSDGVFAGAGGNITSSSGTATLVVNNVNGARSFAGAITGAVQTIDLGWTAR
jgi:hypothetical protein